MVTNAVAPRAAADVGGRGGRARPRAVSPQRRGDAWRGRRGQPAAGRGAGLGQPGAQCRAIDDPPAARPHRRRRHGRRDPRRGQRRLRGAGDRRARTWAPGREVVLYTHLAVREDAMTLYGFPDVRPVAHRSRPCSATGVGPKLRRRRSGRSAPTACAAGGHRGRRCADDRAGTRPQVGRADDPGAARSWRGAGAGVPGGGQSRPGRRSRRGRAGAGGFGYVPAEVHSALEGWRETTTSLRGRAARRAAPSGSADVEEILATTSIDGDIDLDNSLRPTRLESSSAKPV